MRRQSVPVHCAVQCTCVTCAAVVKTSKILCARIERAAKFSTHSSHSTESMYTISQLHHVKPSYIRNIQRAIKLLQFVCECCECLTAILHAMYTVYHFTFWYVHKYNSMNRVYLVHMCDCVNNTYVQLYIYGKQ